MKKSNNRWPVVYAIYYQSLQRIAKRYGYALALHGTLTRDLDLIAVPWIETPSDPINLLRHISKIVNPFEYKVFMKKYGVPYTSTTEKPNGRIAYTISVGGGGYLDISVIRRKS